MRLFIISSSTIPVEILLIIEISDILPTLSYYIVISYVEYGLSFMDGDFDLSLVLDLPADLLNKLDCCLVLDHGV